MIKTIGDEILFVADDPRAAAEVALQVTERGADEDDQFPQVRAGIAYGDVVSRLGDVFGPTVNIASRLTSVARPGTVLVDRGMHEVLSGPIAEDAPDRSCPLDRRPDRPDPRPCGRRAGRAVAVLRGRRVPLPADAAAGP